MRFIKLTRNSLGLDKPLYVRPDQISSFGPTDEGGQGSWIRIQGSDGFYFPVKESVDEINALLPVFLRFGISPPTD